MSRAGLWNAELASTYQLVALAHELEQDYRESLSWYNKALCHSKMVQVPPPLEHRLCGHALCRGLRALIRIAAAGDPRVLLNNSASPHARKGGGDVRTSPPPPLLSDSANFSPGLLPIKHFFWRLRRKSV